MSRSGSEAGDKEHVEDQVIERARTARGLVVSWKQHMYYVPADAVVCFPKMPYKVKDGEALGALLNTKDPAKWLPVCQPEHLVMLKGVEGRSVYVIFSVDGHDDEERIVRPILGSIAQKNFPKVAEMQADPARGTPTDERERELEVLQWRPKDCKSPQLDPRHNGWEQVCTDSVKSCRVEPKPGPRASAKRSSDHLALLDHEGAGNANHAIKFFQSIRVDDQNCEVIRRPNLITVIQFSNNNEAGDADL